MDYAVEIINARFADEPAFDFKLKKANLALIVDPEERRSAGILMLLAGITFIRSGRVLVFGHELEEKRQRIAYLPQDFEVHSTGSVKDLIKDWAKVLKLADPEQSAAEVLDLVDLGAQAELIVNDLSSEQRDWLLFAGALLASPELLLINHRQKFMDYRNKKKLLRLLDKLRSLSAVTIIVAVSSLDELAELADEIFLVKAGRLIPLAKQNLLQTKSKVELIVDNPARAAIVLEAAKIPYRVSGSSSLEAEVEEAWEVNQILIEGGVKLHASIPLENDLQRRVEALLEGEGHGVL
ncbi:MAG: hypothetical protein Q4P08_04240 [Eubacteriales bacterium]|nr:hypothetical protein [Eubacteriales bacterium]